MGLAIATSTGIRRNDAFGSLHRAAKPNQQINVQPRSKSSRWTLFSRRQRVSADANGFVVSASEYADAMQAELSPRLSQRLAQRTEITAIELRTRIPEPVVVRPAARWSETSPRVGAVLPSFRGPDRAVTCGPVVLHSERHRQPT